MNICFYAFFYLSTSSDFPRIHLLRFLLVVKQNLPQLYPQLTPIPTTGAMAKVNNVFAPAPEPETGLGRYRVLSSTPSVRVSPSPWVPCPSVRPGQISWAPWTKKSPFNFSMLMPTLAETSSIRPTITRTSNPRSTLGNGWPLEEIVIFCSSRPSSLASIASGS